MDKLEITPIINRLRKFEGAKPIIDPPDSNVSIDHSYCIAVVIGSALAYHLPLPTDKVGNFSAYFAQTFLELLQETISRINEQYPLRVMVVMDACKDTYKLRYDQVFAPIENIDDILNRICTGNNTTLNNSTGVSLAVSYPEEYKELLKSINLGCLSLNNYKGFII